MPFGGNVGPGDSHIHPRINSHEAWFITDPALCDYTRVGPFRYDSAWWRDLMCRPSSLLAHWHSLVSQRLDIPPAHLTVVSLSPFGLSCRLPFVSHGSLISFPVPLIVFCFSPPIQAVTLEVTYMPQYHPNPHTDVLTSTQIYTYHSILCSLWPLITFEYPAILVQRISHLSLLAAVAVATIRK